MLKTSSSIIFVVSTIWFSSDTLKSATVVNRVGQAYTPQFYVDNNNNLIDNQVEDGNGSDDDFREVTTECGPVQGKRSSEKVYGKKDPVDVYEFRNIPYAQAPVSALRWRPPVKLSKDKSKCWKGTLKYDEKKIVACKQNWPKRRPIPQTEDCLVVTVRTPSLKKDTKLPVMVWIHGGGMMYGYNEMYAYYPYNEFSAHMDVVTVSINYRLGVFGFMSLKELWVNSGPDESYGNYGIMDQIEALKWVQTNIENFGGDPNNVALYGESGGGTAIYCLLGSPLARGLFQKASPASGAPRIRTTHIEADKKYRSVIKQTNCQKSTDADTIKCLQDFDTDKLLAMFKDAPTLTYQWEFPKNVPYTGYPIEVIDPKVVTKSPEQITGSKDHPVELLIGNCAQEIGPFPGKVAPDVNLTTWNKLKKDLTPKMDTFQKGLYPVVLKAYLAEKKDPEQSFTPQYVYEVMSSDALVICTTNQVASHLSKQQNGFTVSRYVFSQPPTKEIGLHLETAYHGWDSVVLFGLKFYHHGPLPEKEQKLVELLRSVYKDFLWGNKNMDQYRGKTTDFWAGATLSTGGVASYHQDECTMWDSAGLLNNSWGDLGKSPV